MLKKFRSEELHKMPEFSDILKEFSKSPDVITLLRDSVFNSSLLLTVRNNPSVLDTHVEFTEVELMEPRHWVQDHTCDYHRKVTQLCPNMRFITLNEYQEYLKRLSIGPEFNTCFKHTRDRESEGQEDMWKHM